MGCINTDENSPVKDFEASSRIARVYGFAGIASLLCSSHFMLSNIASSFLPESWSSILCLSSTLKCYLLWHKFLCTDLLTIQYLSDGGREKVTVRFSIKS